MIVNIQLIDYACHDNLKMTKKILEQGADIHTYDDRALRLSAELGYTRVVKLLLDWGADVHAIEDHALRYSVSNGHHRVVKLLLEHGANVNVGEGFCLYSSAINSDIQMAKLLVEHGADRVKDDMLDTLFRLGDFKAVQILINAIHR
jgi:ankyrin repeat protein